MKKLKIAFAASEVVPFSKTGGLADIAGSLPKTLSDLGNEVIIITPLYKMVRKSNPDIKKLNKKIFVELGDKIIDGEIFTTKIDKNVTVYFIEKDEYYDRDALYGTALGDYKDNAERFIFFSKAVLSLLEELDFKQNIIHCHDWQTGLIPVLLKTIEKDNPIFKKTKTVFTIHNLAYQGLFWHYDMHMTNLPWDVFNPQGIEFYGKMNLMKAGIVFADVINTVSKKYSKEIQTPEYGCGLEGVLKTRSKDLYGILNGVDYDIWNPEKDTYIIKNYSLKNLSGKYDCRKDLLNEYKLDIKDTTPIIGIISRLADQKGFDIISKAIDEIMKMDLVLILLGTGDKRYHTLFQKISEKFPKKAGINIGFNIQLSHKIEAGSDFFLMPSHYEPCGLNQIYSLKYGTIPIVRGTGGLDDTIINFNPETKKGNGFKFYLYTPEALVSSIKKALSVYKNKKLFQTLIKNAMTCDFSWTKSAKEYVKLYQEALQKK